MIKIDLSCLMLAGCMVSSTMASGQEIYFPQRELANESVGLLTTSIQNEQFAGSGTVAHDPRLIFSCAHVLYENGKWAKGYTFYRAWHSRQVPDTGGMKPRGFLANFAYGSAVKEHGMASKQAYVQDMSIFYRNQAFGPAVPVLENSVQALRSRRLKRIIGYPSRLDFTDAKGYYFQHSTGWFPTSAVKRYYGYHLLNDVTTGPGNSGGGIFLMDPVTRKDVFAGLLVGGNDRRAGILAADNNMMGLAMEALSNVSAQRMAVNANSVSLAENSSVTRILRMEDGSGRIQDAELDVEFKDVSGHPPLVFLQSPAGRIHRIAISEDQLTIRGLNLGSALYGSTSEGDWVLRIQTDKQSKAVFGRAALHVTAKPLN